MNNSTINLVLNCLIVLVLVSLVVLSMSSCCEKEQFYDAELDKQCDGTCKIRTAVDYTSLLPIAPHFGPVSFTDPLLIPKSESLLNPEKADLKHDFGKPYSHINNNQ